MMTTPQEWLTLINSSRRMRNTAIETAVDSKNVDILSQIFPGSGYKNMRWLINRTLANGDGGCLQILLKDTKFTTASILRFFQRTDDLVQDGKFSHHEYLSVCSALIQYCPISRARLGRLLTLEGNPVFIQLLTNLQKQKAQKLQRDILTQLQHKQTLLDLLAQNFFTGKWAVLAELVRDEKPLSPKQWQMLFGADTSPAILGSSTVWFSYRQSLTPIAILGAVLFNPLVSKEHRALCWNTYAPLVETSEINALLDNKAGPLVCADFFMLSWKGKPIHSYVDPLSRIVLYFNRSWTQRRAYSIGYNELLQQLQVIYPAWKNAYNYERSANFPCQLP